MADADLEIGIEAGGVGLGYTVRLRLRRENDDKPWQVGEATLDLSRLDDAGEDYGAELSRQVFADPKLIEYFSKAIHDCQVQEVCLRVRLNLGRGAEPLHSLKWERLELPCDDGSGAETARLPFISKSSSRVFSAALTGVRCGSDARESGSGCSSPSRTRPIPPENGVSRRLTSMAKLPAPAVILGRQARRSSTSRRFVEPIL